MKGSSGLLATVCLSVLPGLAEAQADPLDPSRVAEVRIREVARIGGWDDRPGYALTGVRDAVVLSDGRVALIDGGSSEIRIYDGAGVLLLTMGGSGEGPGEFKSSKSIAELGDGRLLAWDWRAQRVTVFEGDGQVAYTSRIAHEALDRPFPRLPPPDFVGAFPDGRVVLRMNPDMIRLRDERPGLRRDSVGFAFFSAEGEPIGHPVAVEGPETRLYKEGASWGTEDFIFAREVISVVTGEFLVVALTDSLHLGRFVDEGRVAPLRLDRPVRSVSRRELRAERRRLENEARAQVEARPRADNPFADESRHMAERKLRRLEDKEAHSTFPAFADLLVGREGRIWIRDYSPPGAETVWWYASDDRFQPVGRLPLPKQERLLAVSDVLLVTRMKDEFDVETVVLYSVEGLGGR